jgi:hypothetical protein
MPRSLPIRWRLLYAGIAATLLLSLLTVGTFEAPTARADTGSPLGERLVRFQVELALFRGP